MAADAVEAGDLRMPTRVAGVASVAVHGLVTVPRTATVLGTSDYAIWMSVADTVIVVSTRDATRLPNSVEIGAEAADGLLTAIDHGTTASIGAGQILFEDLLVNVVRWWDPRPALGSITPEQLADGTPGLPDAVPGVDQTGLSEALTVWSSGALETAAMQLLGSGAGLTPEADDYLAGLLAAVRIFGEALSQSRATRMLDRAARPLARLADARTTAFSAALLRHAIRGQVAEPAGALFRAVAGRGDIREAHSKLESVGHSSGPALAAGIVFGARALTREVSLSERSNR